MDLPVRMPSRSRARCTSTCRCRARGPPPRPGTARPRSRSNDDAHCGGAHPPARASPGRSGRAARARTTARRAPRGRRAAAHVPLVDAARDELAAVDRRERGLGDRHRSPGRSAAPSSRRRTRSRGRRGSNSRRSACRRSRRSPRSAWRWAMHDHSAGESSGAVRGLNAASAARDLVADAPARSASLRQLRQLRTADHGLKRVHHRRAEHQVLQADGHERLAGPALRGRTAPRAATAPPSIPGSTPARGGKRHHAPACAPRSGNNAS